MERGLREQGLAGWITVKAAASRLGCAFMRRRVDNNLVSNLKAGGLS